jgi:hypothetical protein
MRSGPSRVAADVADKAGSCGVHQATVHRWVSWYLTEQLADWRAAPTGRVRVRVVRRTTTLPEQNIKADRPPAASNA